MRLLGPDLVGRDYFAKRTDHAVDLGIERLSDSDVSGKVSTAPSTSFYRSLRRAGRRMSTMSSWAKKGRWRSNVWTYPGAFSLGSDARRGLEDHPTVKPAIMLAEFY